MQILPHWQAVLQLGLFVSACQDQPVGTVHSDRGQLCGIGSKQPRPMLVVSQSNIYAMGIIEYKLFDLLVDSSVSYLTDI